MRENSKNFNLQSYRALLKYIKSAKLKARKFSDEFSGGRNLLMRHDIDFCPLRALELAKVEKKYSINSTYFFLVNTDFYNLHSEENKTILKKILKLGHYIGLHFDASKYNKSANINLACKKELDVLENIISKKVNIVSFHRPIKAILNMNKKIANLNHTYMPKFFKNMIYCSDSEGTWRFETPRNIIEKNKNNNLFTLHLLIHPIWWTTPSNLSPAEKVDFHLERKYIQHKNLASLNCKPYSKFFKKKEEVYYKKKK